MSPEARIALAVLALGYTAWSIWLSRLILRQRGLEQGPNQHPDPARRYRLMVYARLGIRASIAFFLWTFVLLTPTSPLTTFMLALPLVASAVLSILLPIVWRKDLQRLHEQQTS